MSHKPDLFQYTRRAQYDQGLASSFSNSGKQVVEGDKPNLTSHWKTNYTNNVEIATQSEHSKSQRPVWSLPRAAYSSKRSHFTTEYNKSMGTYGHNPRNKLNQESDKMENENHELTMGTTKVTKHIPGYNGYLPKTDLNAKALQ
eukprot:CAMPEP_0116875810 /NCGR_PEP_ID=MMETSP0463-20121206/7908_1 /TAXON_ID=181622 /ORGANISM="Strombidinopsis sp, Strain SopsisLIS2011" /LENGTH=143 /DNA_ID=CAMNT_0004522099 /DNA_START=269 /DNA_END=700 /DNA_ORIENTATION=-